MKFSMLFLIMLLAGCQQLPPIPKGTVGVTVTYTIAGDEKPKSEPQNPD